MACIHLPSCMEQHLCAMSDYCLTVQHAEEASFGAPLLSVFFSSFAFLSHFFLMSRSLRFAQRCSFDLASSLSIYFPIHFSLSVLIAASTNPPLSLSLSLSRALSSETAGSQP